MANYYGTGRSNYFDVTDQEAFAKFCERYELEQLTPSHPPKSGSVGFATDTEDGDPASCHYDEEKDEFTDLPCWTEALAPILAEGSVCVFETAGHEKLRYVAGYAIALTRDGIQKRVSLDDIYDGLPEGTSQATY